MIAAYVYNADILCADCTVGALMAAGLAAPAAADMAAEDVLNQVAGANAIDRDAEETFDSDEFPKVVLANMVQPGEACLNCGEQL